MEGEISNRVIKGRNAIGALTRFITGRNVSIDVKRQLRKSIFLSLVVYGSQT